MALNYDVQEKYIGAGNLDEYTFDFRIRSLDELEIAFFNVAGIELTRFRGVDGVLVTGVDFDPLKGGGKVYLASDLTAGYGLYFNYAPDEPTQDFEFKNKSDFTLSRIERALDAVMGPIQRALFLARRSFKLSPFTDLPDDVDLEYRGDITPGAPIVWDEDGKGFKAGAFPDQAEAANGLPDIVPGVQEEFDYLEINDLLDPVWKKPLFAGFSARYNTALNLQGLMTALNYIFDFQYLAAQISLAASGSGTVREKGASVASTTLTATLTKRSNAIAQVEFFVAPSSSQSVQTSGGGIPNGGNSTYNYATAFTDTRSFLAKVTDAVVGMTGGTVVTSNTVTFTFVYPYYFGAGTTAKTGAQIRSDLTKLDITQNNNITQSFTFTAGQTAYHAFPAAYGNLTAIFDENNFDVTAGWTASTKSITGLDGSSQSYRVYEKTTPFGVSGTTTFKFVR